MEVKKTAGEPRQRDQREVSALGDGETKGFPRTDLSPAPASTLQLAIL